MHPKANGLGRRRSDQSRLLNGDPSIFPPAASEPGTAAQDTLFGADVPNSAGVKGTVPFFRPERRRCPSRFRSCIGYPS